MKRKTKKKCKCGCGEFVKWNKQFKRYNLYKQGIIPHQMKQK